MNKLAGMFLIIFSWISGTVALSLLLSYGKPIWFSIILLLLYAAHTILAKEAASTIIYEIKRMKRAKERGRELAREIDRVMNYLETVNSTHDIRKDNEI